MVCSISAYRLGEENSNWVVAVVVTPLSQLFGRGRAARRHSCFSTRPCYHYLPVCFVVGLPCEKTHPRNLCSSTMLTVAILRPAFYYIHRGSVAEKFPCVPYVENRNETKGGKQIVGQTFKTFVLRFMSNHAHTSLCISKYDNISRLPPPPSTERFQDMSDSSSSTVFQIGLCLNFS